MITLFGRDVNLNQPLFFKKYLIEPALTDKLAWEGNLTPAVSNDTIETYEQPREEDARATVIP